MRTIFTTLFCLALTSICLGQNYQPFNSNSSKRFVSTITPAENDFFFFADSSTTSGNSTIIHQYHTMKNDWTLPSDPPGCTFWGGSSGQVLDTTWLGKQLTWNNLTNELLLTNQDNEPISFDFGLALNSTSSFYSSGNLNYLIEYTSYQLETFYGISDSVKRFTISAVDSNGQSINSDLNNFEIRLSKDYGLLSFINCFNLPLIEETVELQGQTSPDFGNFNLTNDAAYPWQIGDVLQYRNSNSGFTFSHYNYQTLTVTDRIETTDSVWIYFESDIIEPSPAPPWPFTYSRSSQAKVFKKGSFVSYVPWNAISFGSWIGFKPTFGSESPFNYCGGNVNSLSFFEQFVQLCDSCSCFGGYDGNGSSVESIDFAEGYGITSIATTQYGYPINNTQLSSNLIYSQINGVDCGNQWSSVEEIPSFSLSVSPNPTKDVLKIASDHPVEKVRILDLSGRILFSEDSINQKMTEISLASFLSGTYILEVTAAGSIQTRTVIRE